MTSQTLEPTSTPRPTLTRVYKPLPWQIEPWRDKSFIMLLTGSAGGGKSRLASEKLHGYCLKYPGSMALALRKTRESMSNSTVLMMERGVLANQGIRHNQSKNRFEYANGSILAYGGMKDDKQRETIRSIGQEGGLDICWMEEGNGFTEQDFNEILARVRGRSAPWRQIIITTNPDAPTHWIYKRLIEGREATVYKSGAADNSYNPAEYLSTLQRMTGVQKSRLAGGLWVQAQGSVYPEFDPTIHVIKSFRIPASWRRIRSIDFGFVNPFVCLWIALDEDERMYVYREIYKSGRLVEDHVNGVKDGDGNLIAPGINAYSAGESYEATVADHDAEDRATLQRHGVTSTAAAKDVKTGIQAVAERLRIAGDGKPRLFIFEDDVVEEDPLLEMERKPMGLIQEFAGYVWAKVKSDGATKEEPVKLNDHGLDALRYAVAEVDDISSQKIEAWSPETVRKAFSYDDRD